MLVGRPEGRRSAVPWPARGEVQQRSADQLQRLRPLRAALLGRGVAEVPRLWVADAVATSFQGHR